MHPARQGDKYMRPSEPHTGSRDEVEQEQSMLHCDEMESDDASGEEGELVLSLTRSWLGQDNRKMKKSGKAMLWAAMQELMAPFLVLTNLLRKMPLRKVAEPPAGTTRRPTI